MTARKTPSKTENKSTSETPAVPENTPENPYAKETALARPIIQQIGDKITSADKFLWQLVAIVLMARSHTFKAMKSADPNHGATYSADGKLQNRGKRIEGLPAWDGRDEDYRDWYSKTLIPMLEEFVAADYRGAIRSRLQNRVQLTGARLASGLKVQIEVNGWDKPTRQQYKHLGLSLTQKGKPKDKDDDKSDSNGKANADKDRPTDEVFTVDAFLEAFKSLTLADQAMTVQALALAYSENLSSAAPELSKTDVDRYAKHHKTYTSALMSAAATLQQRSEVLKATKSGVKVEAPEKAAA